MRRFGALLVAVLILGLLAGPAVAQDNGLDGPYVLPGVEEPEPVPPVRPAPPVDVDVRPVEVRPAPPVARALPVTGFDLTVGALLAAGLLLAGGGALYAARRKAAAAPAS